MSKGRASAGRGTRSASCLLLLIATACGGADADWAGSVAVVDGVTRTTSPGEPLADPSDVSVRELWSYAGPAEGDVWGLPRSLGVGTRHVFVVDDQADQIHIVGVDGEPAGSLGRPGQGPGEYARPVAAVPTDEGTFLVDGRNTRIDVVDESLTIVRSFDTGAVVFTALPWGGDSIIVQGMVDGEPRWMAWDGSGVAATPVALSALEREDPDGSGCYVVATAGEHVLQGRCTRLELSVFTRTGVLRKHIRVDLPPVMATDDEVEARVSALRETLSRTSMSTAFVDQQVAAIRRSDRAKGMIRKIVPSPEMGLIAVWWQNPEDYGSGPATLHLLDDDGVYLTSLDFQRPWYDVTIRDGVLYALEREESTGLVSLVARRVEVVESLMERAAALGG